jgi:hypothetical protein
MTESCPALAPRPANQSRPRNRHTCNQESHRYSGSVPRRVHPADPRQVHGQTLPRGRREQTYYALAGAKSIADRPASDGGPWAPRVKSSFGRSGSSGSGVFLASETAPATHGIEVRTDAGPSGIQLDRDGRGVHPAAGVFQASARSRQSSPDAGSEIRAGQAALPTGVAETDLSPGSGSFTRFLA